MCSSVVGPTVCSNVISPKMCSNLVSPTMCSNIDSPIMCKKTLPVLYWAAKVTVLQCALILSVHQFCQVLQYSTMFSVIQLPDSFFSPTGFRIIFFLQCVAMMLVLQGVINFVNLTICRKVAIPTICCNVVCLTMYNNLVSPKSQSYNEQWVVGSGDGAG